MNNWKPKNLDEALDDAIGSALNDNSETDDIPGVSSYLLDNNFENVIKEAIKNIKNIKGLKMVWRGR